MKAKKSFDSARIKKFFADHGEKVGLAAGIVVTVLVLYSAFQVTPYQRKPSDLQSAVRTGRDTLDKSHTSSRFNPAADGVVLPSKDETFIEVIKRELIKPIQASQFAGVEWNRPLFETKQRRKEPPYLALRDLRAQFVYGSVNVRGSNAQGGDSGVPQGEEWIAVTGLVPIEEQTAGFTKAFQNALDPLTNARPVYNFYEIRRADVTADPNAAVDWEQVPPVDLQAAVSEWLAKWPAPGAEVADKSVVSWPPLTEPIPPLTNADEYGPWATHPSLVVVSAPGGAAPQAPAAAPVAPAARDPFGRLLGPAPVAPAPVPAPAADAAAAPGNEVVAEDNLDAAGKPRVKYLLFRFLDFNIEPGKQYRYQVKLVLANPNYNLDTAHLEKPELAVGETRETAWSDPSPLVAVPYLDRSFAGSVKSVGGDTEPVQSLGVRSWFPSLAADGFVKFDDFMRGAMLNVPATTVTYAAPGTRAKAESSQAVNSGHLLVDFAWERTDQKLKGPSDRPNTVNRPAETLILNPRGELKVAIQSMDFPVWEELKSIEEGVPAAPADGGTGAPATPEAPAPGSAKSLFKL